MPSHPNKVCVCWPVSLFLRCRFALQLQELSMQVLERIAEEIDPEGTGLSFDDFLSIVSRMPDFITHFRMAV